MKNLQMGISQKYQILLERLDDFKKLIELY